MLSLKECFDSNKFEWSSDFAYAVGLIASDGSLSKDGRHIDLTSIDIEQLENFKKCLHLNNKIGTKYGSVSTRLYYRVQFGNIAFYNFLLSIGFTQRKSRTLGSLSIPREYFFDFLRGEFDGDGSFYSYFDPRWKSSFMFYTVFNSGSPKHVEWLRSSLFELLNVKGHISAPKRGNVLYLRYAKKESLRILRGMYRDRCCVSLSRKREKIEAALNKTGERLFN